MDDVRAIEIDHRSESDDHRIILYHIVSYTEVGNQGCLDVETGDLGFLA